MILILSLAVAVLFAAGAYLMLKHDLVRLIVDMAHGLGHDVVAEGVETAEQLAALRKLGCHKGQGYYFSAPLAPEAVAEHVGSLLGEQAA